MRKHVKVFATFMSMTMLLTGCQSADLSLTGNDEIVIETEAPAETQAQAEAEGQAMTEEQAMTEAPVENAATSNDEVIEQFRVKYATADKVNYQEPMHLLPEDYKFVFENVSADVFSGDVYSDIKVFSDSELTGYVDISIEEDYDNNKITVEPNIVFNIDGEDGSTSVTDGTWGSRSKFYLVQYRNLQTNEMYEKPMVTVFTIAKELDTPTVKQSVSPDGYYQLTWEPVKGADSYEVYSFDSSMEYADLLMTTDKTTVNSSEFAEYWADFEEEEDEWDEMVDDLNWSMNTNLDVELDYFVVARSSNGKVSGMSNLCKIADIANTVPVRQEFGTETFYEGTTVKVLPTHTNIEMLDGTLAKVLINYKNCEIIAVSDTCYQLNVTTMNLPIDIQPLYFDGMEEDAFMADMEKVFQRQEGLETKSVTQESNVEIPFVPTQDDTVEENTQPEDTAEQTTAPEETVAPEETTAPEATEAPEETSAPAEVVSENTNLDEELDQYLYANTALSAWLGWNLLHHEEVICLDGFEEASDSEYLVDALLEAQQQNPLVDVVEEIAYDYETNSLYVNYLHTAAETRQKQAASIEMAKEIAANIITDGMSDFEKEEAINAYLCQNGSYNESIFEYIGEDGTISEDVLADHGNSFLPYGILVENVGVCESYSEAFWLIAKNAGLDVIIETGRMDGVNHEWNRVKIDDSWCVLDVTNNDSEYIPNCYFNLSDETSAGILIPDYTCVFGEYYWDYEAMDNEKEYYYQKGQYAYGQDEAVEMLCDDLATNPRAAVRIAEELDETGVDEVVGAVVYERGLTTGMYFYNDGVLSILTDITE